MNKKIARTFRLDPATVEKILYIQALYSERMGIKLSQADVIEFLVKNEYKTLNKE